MAAEDRKTITSDPENSETPFNAFRSWITPNPSFYVRNHFDTPTVNAESWALTVSGCLERNLGFSWDDLCAMPSEVVVATMECAGNGRSFLLGNVPGVQWGVGAVGNAEWSGIRVSTLLEHAGPTADALEVVFEGADRGTEPEADGDVRFARSLPLDLALHPETLIALRMNGELLTPEHGFPARLVVPGWYGVASVKWLQSIRVVDEPFQGFFQTTKYTVKRNSARGVKDEVVGIMLPKSEIMHPRPGDALDSKVQLVEGLAWAGPEAVAGVELSIDGGQSWQSCEVVGPRRKYCWTRWRFEWRVPKDGDYVLLSRVVSLSGEIQPVRHNPMHGGYHINFSRPLKVTVSASKGRKSHVFAI